ncbi:MAG: MFS transporter [Lentihominibacter sp.]
MHTRNNQRNTLSFKSKCGYGSAAVGDAMAYTFTGTYLLFFLTTVAGIKPAMAGTITVIASIWDAVINPVFGYISDNFSSRFGRRRPFMFGSVLPLMACIVLLFTATDFSYELKVVYYCFMSMAFWTSFTAFFVPFYALGAEYSDNYDERTTLRSYASFFNLIGTFFSMALPPVIVDHLSSLGLSVPEAWTVTAIMIAVIAGVSIIITAASSKQYDITDTTVTRLPKLSLKGLIKDYASVLTLKPTKYVLAACLFALIAYGMIMGDFMYFLTYKIGLSGIQTSTAMFFRCLVGICLIPPAMLLCRKTDNRRALITVFLISSLLMVSERFIGVHGLITLGIFIMFTCIATGTYWQIMPAIVYELCVYDEYTTGKKREGSIVSVQGLVESIAQGIGAQILGIILQLTGFNGDATVQSDLTNSWIINCTTWVPVIFILAAVFALYKYPVSREAFNKMSEKINSKNND